MCLETANAPLKHTAAAMVLRPFVEEPKGSVANYPYFERGKDSTMAYLYRLFQERIVMFDGAMGTMIQMHKLGEEEFRGERFKVSGQRRVAYICALPRVLRGVDRQRAKSFKLFSCVFAASHRRGSQQVKKKNGGDASPRSQ